MMDDLERPYNVQFTDTSLKNLRRYPTPDQRRILTNIEELATSAAHNAKRQAIGQFRCYLSATRG